MSSLRTLPTAPLTEYVQSRFDTDEDAAAALDVKVATIRGWRHRPRIGAINADRLAVRLGRHPYDIWGWQWFETPDNCDPR
jgi:hypothetical protein